jgi:toxin CcdB
MAQFDVHRLEADFDLVVDCQADLLQHLNTRLVVPLILRERAPSPADRLNPVFMLGGREHVMVTQFAASVPCRELGEVLVSLRDRAFEIVGALDVLVSGV